MSLLPSSGPKLNPLALLQRGERQMPPDRQFEFALRVGWRSGCPNRTKRCRAHVRQIFHPAGATIAGQPDSSAEASWLQCPDFRRKDIAVATNGFDQGRSAGIVLDLLTQAAHLVVNTPVEELRRSTGREVKQLLARKHDVRSECKYLQQAKVGGAERDRYRIRPK